MSISKCSESCSPFGMVMPGRSYNNGDGFRYGFNSFELDNEIAGTSNSINAEARNYNPRLGRWHSVDPAAKEYPFISPYVFCANNPTWFYEVDGRIIDISNLSDDERRSSRSLGHLVREQPIVSEC